VELIASGLREAEPDRPDLALGALLAAWASGSAGYAFIHVLCQTTVRVAGTPHAQTYAVMLPHGLRLLESRTPDLLELVAVALGGSGSPADQVAALTSAADLSGLSELGVTESDVGEIVAQACTRVELQNTPGPPGADELERLVRSAL
jgi:maleylacetate reductase